MQSNESTPPLPASEKARGDFDLRSKRRTAERPAKLYLAIGGVVIFALLALGGIWWYVFDQFGKSSTGVEEANVQADASLNAPEAIDDSMRRYQAEQIRKRDEEEQRLKDDEEARKAEEERKKNAHQDKLLLPASTPNSNTGQGQSIAETPAQRKMSGGVFTNIQDQVSSGRSGASGPATGSTPGGIPGSPPVGLGASSSRASLDQLSGTGFASASAYLAPPGDYLLAHNTYARCVLYTEIVTENPGLIDCRLSDPIYSANGKTVIAEAGAKMTGEQRVQVKPGQQQVFTSWTELETSNGVRAQINSLGAGPLGASGTAAWIDYHYKERFLGAVALTFLQDVLQAASNSTQKSNSGYTVNNSEQNVESMASKVLDNSINMENTGHILPGTVLTVIFARDIDFSTVFENR